MYEPFFTCSRCPARYPVTLERWRCDCGGPLEASSQTAAALHVLEPDPVRDGLWAQTAPTPLLPLPGYDNVLASCDYMLPSGSFKDRGARVMVALARRLGAERVVADSSGNAGSALALYCANAGLRCEVYVPSRTSPGKLAQMRALGADVRLIDGGRERASAAAQERAAWPGVFYAAHGYHPLYLHGVASLAIELRQRLPPRTARPVTIVVPAGSGSLLLGLALGLYGVPDWRIIAVQTATCAPLIGLPPGEAPSIAEGVLVPNPPRLAQMRRLTDQAAGGIAKAVAVDEDAVAQAHADLIAAGFYVEPTAALPLAALSAGHVPADETVVLVLTGAGWKTERRLA